MVRACELRRTPFSRSSENSYSTHSDEWREALRELRRVRETYERVLQGYERVQEDLERAEERSQNALRLLKDAM